MAFQSTKTYGTDRGLSCCFRQWRANHSHCSTLHGYSLGFKFVFESETLDEKNWCFDFGGMKPIKQYLDYMFDHTILVAEDDPALEFFKSMAAFSTKERFNGSTDHIGYQEPTPYELGRICDLRIVPGVGCEMTAKMVFEKSAELLHQMQHGDLGRYSVNPDVRLVSVECFEHAGNSAIYMEDRKVSYVEVGDLPEDKIKDYLDTVKEEIHQRKMPNTASKEYQDAFLKSYADEFLGRKPAKTEAGPEVLEAIRTAIKGGSSLKSSDVLSILVKALQPKPTEAEFDISAFGWELAELLKIPTKPKK